MDGTYRPLSLYAPVNLSNLIRGLLIRPNPPQDIASLQSSIANTQPDKYFSAAAIYPSDGSAATDNSVWLNYYFSAKTFKVLKGQKLFLDLGFNFPYFRIWCSCRYFCAWYF